MPKNIPLTKGRTAIVDDEDYERISSSNWCVTSQGYAKRYAGGGRKNPSFVYMHRELMGVQGEVQVDHINGDRLDNRKSNLRLCSSKSNSRNRRGWGLSKKTSRYKGVCWSKTANAWLAMITVDRKAINLGNFADELLAAHAYDNAALSYFGDFAKLNDYDEQPKVESHSAERQDHKCSSLNCEGKHCKLKGRFNIDGKWWCTYHRPDRLRVTNAN